MDLIPSLSSLSLRPLNAASLEALPIGPGVGLVDLAAWGVGDAGAAGDALPNSALFAEVLRGVQGQPLLMLASPAGLLINGLPAGCLAIAKNGDVVRVAGEPDAAIVEVNTTNWSGLAPADSAESCACCHAAIAGRRVIRCGGCGLWYHAEVGADALACASVVRSCVQCNLDLGIGAGEGGSDVG